jgi:hypothetical protein
VYTEDSCNKSCHTWEQRFHTNIVGHVLAKNVEDVATLPNYWPKAMEAVKDMLEYPDAYAGTITAEERAVYGDSAPLVMTPAKFLVVVRRLTSGQVQRLNYNKTPAGKKAAAAAAVPSPGAEGEADEDAQPAAGG